MQIRYLLEKTFLKVLPVNKKRIVFTSFYGHYSDSPKYISEQIYSLNKNLELVWLVDEKYFSRVPDYCKKIKYGSWKAKFYYGTAHIIIDNTYCEKEIYLRNNTRKSRLKVKIYNYLNDKKKQKCYTTWHGMPVKKMGIDEKNNDIIEFYCSNTTMFLDSKHAIKIMKRLTFNKLKYILLGCPRNDMLYNIDENNIIKTKKELNIPIEKKVVLFAPTFRTDGVEREKNINRSGINQINSIDFDKLFETLNKKFGGDWVFICRFHYHVQNLIDWDEINKKYEGKLINGNENDEMSKYLLISDVIISDISSCLFDFSITKRPGFIFFPDFNYYDEIERGLYININELPYPFSETFEQLIENIKAFDYAKYEESLKKLIDKCEFIINDKSAQDIAKYILKESDLYE